MHCYGDVAMYGRRILRVVSLMFDCVLVLLLGRIFPRNFCCNRIANGKLDWSFCNRVGDGKLDWSFWFVIHTLNMLYISSWKKNL